MKKLTIKIPKWAEGTRIVVLAGTECLATYDVALDGEYVRVKENRCVQCGKCCRWKPGFPIEYFDPEGVGKCDFLVKEVGDNNRWICRIAAERPISCLLDPNRLVEGCSITHCLDYSAIEEIDE